MHAAVLFGALVFVPALVAATPVEIHPAGPSVPENLLRIELRFKEPQRLPFNVHRVMLLGAAGVPLRDAFLDLALPSADAKRITILMNPGRVKSGVGPNVALDRSLRAGERVRLVVEDAQHHALPVSNEWLVTPFLADGPRPPHWQVHAPRMHSRDPLRVSLNAPISSTGEGWIAVRDDMGKRVRGRAALANGDTVWRFIPDLPWRPAFYAVVAHPDLEDPAGNRSCAAFEQARASDAACEEGSAIPFKPR
jgi:hypothetical protein